MPDLRNLIHAIHQQQSKLPETRFISPCLPNSKITTRIAGLIYTFTPIDPSYEGWGIFQPQNEQTACKIEDASLPEIEQYLEQFQSLRVRLIFPIKGQTWLAYPINETAMRERVGAAKPIAIHLVTEGLQFRSAIGRWTGKSLWFESTDFRADPIMPDQLNECLRQGIIAEDLRLKGLTPEDRIAYQIASQHTKAFSGQGDEQRLRSALTHAGGELRQFEDRGQFWRVEWTTSDGERHISAISKEDLTVMNSGICLSGRDRQFDLTSLVGVIEKRYSDSYENDD
ncbi:hypothetical protein ACQ4M3_07390 [Leptolyngbya sp. AN03gr2]|uniref:hypothetical protein n=1 Tax=unclassified Leptolyngbya TaxID=2650499 RepID=UPI003D315CF8